MAPTDPTAEVVLGLSDIEDALLLSDEARWNQTAEDWAVFINSGEIYGIRAGDRLVASAAILPYQGSFGWISMVLVTADWRRRGLASGLMNRCIEAMRSRGAASLLDATPEGAMVYRQLGFRSCCGMARWRGMGLRGVSADKAADALVSPDRAKVFGVDARAFGGDRRFLIDGFLDRPGTILLGDDESYVLIRQGRRAVQIGPLVASSDAEARELLEAALAAVSGPVIVDLLDAGAGLRPLLASHGFEAFRTFERMILDRADLPGMPANVMIAAGPEFG